MLYALLYGLPMLYHKNCLIPTWTINIAARKKHSFQVLTYKHRTLGCIFVDPVVSGYCCPSFRSYFGHPFFVRC